MYNAGRSAVGCMRMSVQSTKYSCTTPVLMAERCKHSAYSKSLCLDAKPMIGSNVQILIRLPIKKWRAFRFASKAIYTYVSSAAPFRWRCCMKDHQTSWAQFHMRLFYFFSNFHLIQWNVCAPLSFLNDQIVLNWLAISDNNNIQTWR